MRTLEKRCLYRECCYYNENTFGGYCSNEDKCINHIGDYFNDEIIKYSSSSENEIYENLIKIYKLFLTELNSLKFKKRSLNQLKEVASIKEEAKIILEDIKRDFINQKDIIWIKNINKSYEKIYIKIKNSLDNIKSNFENDENIDITLFDYLSELIPNIYVYTKRSFERFNKFKV